MHSLRMDHLPVTVLTRIFEFLPFDERHVVMRVNRLWHEAARSLLRTSCQKRLRVYPDDEHDDGDVYAIRVKRLLHVFRCRCIHIFVGFESLDVRTATQHRYDDIEYGHEGATLLTRHQTASLIRQMAETLTGIRSERCDVLKRIFFPVIVSIDCSSSSDVDPLSPFVLDSCPQLKELSCGSIEMSALDRLPIGLESLRIGLLDVDRAEDAAKPMNAIRKLKNLKQLSVTGDGVLLTNGFFADMHKLETVELCLFYDPETRGDEEDRDDAGADLMAGLFSDSGISLLLNNNDNLKQVSLSTFNFTECCLTLFADYAESHGIEKVSLKSLSSSSRDAVVRLAERGACSSLQSVSILSDDPEHNIQILVNRHANASIPELQVTTGLVYD